MRDDTVQLRFTRALVDEWARHGVKRAFISPGSRSTPLVVALEEYAGIETEVFIDERCCSFAALGASLGSGVPSVIACTSGTAGAHFLAAAAEANLSAVPLIICTADRPPELTAVGAPQAIDQVSLFGSHVRFSLSPGLPEMATANTWRSLGSRMFLEATGSRPGPVHLNLAFQEPLLPAEDLEDAIAPNGRKDGKPWHDQKLTARRPTADEVNEVVELISDAKGLIVAGKSNTDPQEIVSLGQALGWPIIASPQANISSDDRISNFDQLLRQLTWRETVRPEVILRFGELPSSKYLTNFISDVNIELLIADLKRWNNPTHSSSRLLEGNLWASELAGRSPRKADDAWLEIWRNADRQVGQIIDTELASTEYLSGPEIVRQVAKSASDRSVFVASSMPIRDFEWFADAKPNSVFANRGTNGIDGLVASAYGIAKSRGATTALIGDLGFLHDSNALIEVSKSNTDLLLVVIDNKGGQIFSHLPQSSLLPQETFDKLFTTRRDVDLLKLCEAVGIQAAEWAGGELAPVLSNLDSTRPRVIVARSDNDLELYSSIESKVTEALS